MEKTGILLINLGTPLSYKPKDVRLYLNEFLSDPRVIDLPFLTRHLLVKGVIVPLRYRQSAKSYKEIWTEEGAPLLKYAQKTKDHLQTLMGNEFVVELGMRYQEPSIELGLRNLQKHPLKNLVVIPLFPQYASATTGSIYEKLFKILSKWNVIPKLKIVNSFYDHPRLIEAFSSIAKSYEVNSYDHILMSFHGLPERHIKKADPYKCCLESVDCCQSLSFKKPTRFGDFS
jgi:ferrochelatase